NSVIITPGQKVLTISSDGYANEETIFNFRGHDSYKISVTLHPETQIALNMTALNTEGQFYFNALSNDLQKSLGTLPSSTVLGEFIDVNGISTYFLSEIKDSVNNENLSGELVGLNRSVKDQIERSRKVMYGSYSALILSLPLLFTAIGTYESMWDPAQRQLWSTIRWASAGVSIALGVNFLAQLIVYLVKVNKVLPAEIKLMTPSERAENEEKKLQAKLKKPKKEKKASKKSKKEQSENSETEEIDLEKEQSNSAPDNTTEDDGDDNILLVLPPNVEIE
ncbi:MAG: hypothetical protein ACRC5H_00805, partial [Treponemataceae bacterium]